MIDPITTYLASFFMTHATKLFEGYVGDKIEDIKNILSVNLHSYQKEEYEKNKKAKTILHRVEPVDLDKFYLPLFLRKNNSTQRISTQHLEKLAQKEKCITVIGNAGSGKSTILKYLLVNSIESKFKIPIKIELRYLNTFDGTLIDYIDDKVFKLHKISEKEKIISKLLATGDFVLFLDGYDEISSSKKEKVTKEIDELTSIYSNNIYILTSRPYTDIELLPKFVNYTVCELSDEDINKFIAKQISESEKEIQNKLIEAVNNRDNRALKSYLSNPLLLSMFILTFQSHASIPQKKSDFYAQVFEALYSLHDSMSKLAYVREIQSGLSKDQIIEVLKTFSFVSYFEEKFIFPKEYTNERLNRIKEKKNIAFNNEKLMQDLLVAINIITLEGLDYSFPHRSMQEYFAAIYIKGISEENKEKIYAKISTHINTQRVESKSNFLQILLEVDERTMIKECLIKYLEKLHIKSKEENLRFMDTREIIDIFINIYDFHGIFHTLICPNRVFDLHRDFTKKFSQYRAELGKKFGVNDQNSMDDKINEMARKMLVDSDIRPALLQEAFQLENTINGLRDRINEENKNDSDLIDMV